VDSYCNTVNFVAAGTCEQLYNGRFHPYPAGDSRYHSADQFHPGPENHAVRDFSINTLSEKTAEIFETSAVLGFVTK